MAGAEIGVYGLGVMGANLALNIADSGHKVAVYNRKQEKVRAFMDGAGPLEDRVTPTDSPEALVEAIDRPRAIVLMVPAGGPVTQVIETLIPLLDEGDLIIDAGNADFQETRRREAELAEKNLNFIGMGVSGGAEGARHGPSIMVGGPRRSYEPIEAIIEGIAADYQGTPCAAWLGPDGAGHFVKTVHNGIEYADMELIAEIYGLLRDGEGQDAEHISELFAAWNQGPLQSFLVEITAKVLRATDPNTGGPVIDTILDSAGQKGTGRWTVIEALKLGRSPSTIEAAVGARSWSAEKEARTAGADLYDLDAGLADPVLEADLEQALLAARTIAYGQGFNVLAAASDEFGWDLDLARIAEIWRAGCIIRSAMLDDIASAVRDGLPHGHLIYAPHFVRLLRDGIPALRRVVASGIERGLPVPGLAAALTWFDTMRQARGTTALIQAQRDFFGQHGYEGVEGGEDLHGPW